MLRDIDPGQLLARVPRVDARDLAHSREQTLETRHVVEDHGQERAPLPLRGRGDGQLRCRADRGQGILELVRHVRGEGFHEAEVLLQALRELPQAAGQVADLVAPPRRGEGAAQPSARIEDPAGLAAQPVHGHRDRGGDQEAQDSGRGDRCQGQAHDVQAQRVQVVQDPVGGLRDEHDPGSPAGIPDGDRAVQRDRLLAARRDARGSAVAAREGFQHLGPGDPVRSRVILVPFARRHGGTEVPAPRADGRGGQAVQDGLFRAACLLRLGRVLPGTLRISRGSLLFARPQPARVREDHAVGVQHAKPGLVSLAQPPQDAHRLLPETGACLVQRGREHPSLLHEGVLEGAQELLLPGRQEQEPPDGKEHDKKVEREDADRDARERAAQPACHPTAPRASGSPGRRGSRSSRNPEQPRPASS